MNKILDQEISLSSLKNIENEKVELEEIGSIVKNFRAQRGISRQILADRSGISIRYLAQLESGKANPSISILKNIAYALNLTLENMLFINSKNNSEIKFIINRLEQCNLRQIEQVLTLVNDIGKKNHLKKKKNKIALIGLRGAGKSTLGNLLSKDSKIPIFEVSNEIEKLGGMNISEIIEFGGQGMYRRLEYNVITSLYKNYKELIILPGGSVVSENETYNFLLKNFSTIWIKANPKEHMNRVINQGDSRPIESNPRAMEDLLNILKERNNLYSKADIIINTEGKNIKESYKDLKLKVNI